MGSGAGLSDGVARCILALVNIIFFLCGGAVLAFGIIELVDPQLVVNLFNMIPGISNLQYYINITQALLNSAITLTVIGAVIVVMTVVGCCGAMTRNSCLSMLYIISVLLLMMFELAVVMWAAIEKKSIDNRVADVMFSSLQQNFAPSQVIGTVGPGNSYSVVYSTSEPALAWESLQFKYSCCGARGYTDYQDPGFSNWTNTVVISGVSRTNAIVPPSCCLQDTLYDLPDTTATFVDLNKCLFETANSTYARVVTGCYVAVVDQMSEYTFITVVIIASLIAIEMLVIMLTMAGMKRENPKYVDPRK